MFKPIYCAFVLPLAFALVGCSDNDNAISTEKNGPKPAMELQVTPKDEVVRKGTTPFTLEYVAK